MSPRAALAAAALGLLGLAVGACGGGASMAQPPASSAPPAGEDGSGPSASRPAGSGATPNRPTGPLEPGGVLLGFDLEAAEDVATGLEVPWGLAFLPDGAALVTERETGRILRVAPGRAPTEVARIDVRATGEGGLLGIAVSPRYAADRQVFVFSSDGLEGRIDRLRGEGSPPERIFSGIPGAAIHTGGRLAFGPDGRLYASAGDAGTGKLAQDADSLAGKILRLMPDGSVPSDNPDPGSAVWSLGHRNVEGFTWDDAGRMWATEFGEAAWDEVNLIEAGENYGWPAVEGRGGDTRFRDPVVIWTTAEASPAGVAYADGRLLVGALRGERLWMVPLDGAAAGAPVAAGAARFGRVRVVELAPDGSLWIATSNRDGRGVVRPGDDRIVRIPPG